VAGDIGIGPIQIQFRYEGRLNVLSTSGDQETWKQISDDSEVIEGVQVPTWIEFTTSGGAEPDRRVRVELRDGSPRVVEMSWTSQPHQSEIRQKHIRGIDPARLGTALYASVIVEKHAVADFEQLSESMRIARKFVERQREPRERRVMTPEFLRSVAQVYRDNIDGTPTKAVAKMFNVKDRMASTYVDRARQKGYLPPTKQGQKRA
jgi:hypothetical protein